jgi:hypothetical protein
MGLACPFDRTTPAPCGARMDRCAGGGRRARREPHGVLVQRRALVRPPRTAAGPARVRPPRSATHGATITGWALTIGVVHVVVSVVLARTSTIWFGAGMTVVVVIQMYALVALPVSLAGLSFKGVPRTQRLGSTVATAALTFVALAPGLVLTRLAVALMNLDVQWIGVVALIVAVLVQVAATSSVRTVVLATKLNVAASHQAVR